MPVIVDREEVQKNIIYAFQECIKEQPLAKISMRDVARKAHMSHQKMFYYFKDKNDLVYSYVRYAKDFLSNKCIRWFEENDRKNFKTNGDYINSFLKYIAEGREDEHRPNATVQIYVMSQYDTRIEKMVRDVFFQWKETMRECLVKNHVNEAGEKEAEAMMILIAGTFLCKYNKVLSGSINAEILKYILRLNEN
jgi:AcrR family transcriptional regulator